MGVYRFLLTPRWMAVNLLVLALLPVMVKLGFWQFDRHDSKVARNDLISSNVKRAPVPADQVMTVGGDVTGHDRWRPVTITGRYDATHELLARQRTQADETGYLVITPLVTADGRAVLVNRGWVAQPESAGARPDVPAPPAGEVTVTGRLRPSETRALSGIRDREVPAGQIMRIESARIAATLPYPLYGGYAELVSQSPQPQAAPAPVPEPDAEDLGPHLAYAVQWWLFAAALFAMWIRLIRREAAELEAELAALDDADEDGDGAETAPGRAGSGNPADPADPADPEDRVASGGGTEGADGPAATRA